MEKIATFTITQDGKLYNIKSKNYKTYDQIGVTINELYDKMVKLTDVFNNILGIGVIFEID